MLMFVAMLQVKWKEIFHLLRSKVAACAGPLEFL